MRPVAATIWMLVLGLFPVAPQLIAASTTCPVSGVPTTTLYLPNITKTLGGPAGWVTPFIVQNIGTTPTTLEVAFYRFTDGALVACRAVPDLQPGTSFADVPNNDADLPHDSQFSVVVKSYGAEVVAVVNQHQGRGVRAEALSYAGMSRGSTRVGLPYLTRSSAGWLTTVVIQNIGTASAVVTASLATSDGSRTAILTRTIAPGRSQFIDPTVEPTIAPGAEYAAVVTSNQPIGVVVNAHNNAPGTIAPRGFSYNGIAGDARTQYMPLALRNVGGRTSRILVQNTGTAPATPELAVQRLGLASAVTVRPPLPIAPGRSWSFDPRFAADGRTPCPPAGTAECVGEGEHSVTVSGGSLATLNVMDGAATASGFAAQVASPSRVYLPNVTRALGGASGWTTRILVQSAGATSATLRWYRFTDGSLALTQQLALTAGATLSIDPRGVSGLANDKQYAVVIDARGPIVGVVLASNGLGGDSDMIYEGFAASESAAPRPFTISLRHESLVLSPGGTQQLSAGVRDQFDSMFATQPVTWSVSPSALATIGPTGVLTAGSVAGTAIVTATAGQARASATLTVAPPQTRTVGGLAFRYVATATAEAYAEQSISEADAQTIFSSIDGDVAHLQKRFARSLQLRPTVYAFASEASATSGYQTIFGLTTEDAARFARAGGIFDSRSGSRVGLNWHVLSDARPLTATRHELTHMMVRQIVGARAVPAWLNEGTARLEEFSLAGSLYWADVNRYTAASVSAVSPAALIPLSELVSQLAWSQRTGSAKSFQYYEASEAVRLLRDDIGFDGTVRILELMREGLTFDSAFLSVSGGTFAGFAQAFPARLRASASYPGIAATTDTSVGVGLNFIAYGFTPGATLTYSYSGPSVGTFSDQADEYGTLRRYITTALRWLPGAYTISVRDASGRTVQATATLAGAAAGSLGGLPSAPYPPRADALRSGE